MIVSLIIVALAAIAFIFLNIQKTPQTTEKFQQNLNIPNYFQGTTLPIKNNINASDFNFPTTMPYLQQRTVATLNTPAITNIATNLGFTDQPQTFDDIQNGQILIWNGDKYSLTATPRISSIQLSSNSTARILVQNTIDKQLSESDFKSLAEDFLINKINLNKGDIKLSSFTYYKTQNGVEYLAKTDKSSAQIIQLNYSESPSKYPVLTVNPEQSQISIQFLKDGSILTFTANLGYRLDESANQYPIKNWNQFSDEIKNSVLVSLNDNNVNLPDLKTSDIQSINIDKVSLVYLLDFSNQGIIQPVFLLEGQANVNNFVSPISASLYLPAFEGFNQP